MSKYKNKKVVIDGIKFDSDKEGKYYLYLKQMQDEGKISCLKTQVAFEIIPAVRGKKMKIKHLKRSDKMVEVEYTIQKATYYVADFVYIVTSTGKREVVDVKSAITRRNPVYRLKKKLMLAVNNIDIVEV